MLKMCCDKLSRKIFFFFLNWWNEGNCDVVDQIFSGSCRCWKCVAANEGKCNLVDDFFFCQSGKKFLWSWYYRGQQSHCVNLNVLIFVTDERWYFTLLKLLYFSRWFFLTHYCCGKYVLEGIAIWKCLPYIFTYITTTTTLFKDYYVMCDRSIIDEIGQILLFYMNVIVHSFPNLSSN